MKMILTKKQVRDAIYQDEDFDVNKLEELSIIASSFLQEKTGYDFADVEEDGKIEPLAIQAGIMYVRSIYFAGENYNPNFDYSFGLTAILIDLQNIANRKMREKK